MFNKQEKGKTNWTAYMLIRLSAHHILCIKENKSYHHLFFGSPSKCAWLQALLVTEQKQNRLKLLMELTVLVTTSFIRRNRATWVWQAKSYPVSIKKYTYSIASIYTVWIQAMLTILTALKQFTSYSFHFRKTQGFQGVNTNRYEIYSLRFFLVCI